MNNKSSVEKKIAKLIYIVASLLIIFSFIFIIGYCINSYSTKKQINLLNEISIYENNNDIENTNVNDTLKEPTTEPIVEMKTERMLQVDKLKEENSDIVGWIEIENTNISYPVLQASDNNFYMNRNYKKEKSISGSIFLDKAYDFNIPSSNLLIYGHNMDNGTMFHNLIKYKDKSFYDAHPTIRFTTPDEDVYYDIIAAFRSKVYYKDEKNVFRYYYFVNAENEDEYNNFVANSKNASLYDTGKSASYGEQLMTLSTCAYHVTDGRFVVVAKKGEKYK